MNQHSTASIGNQRSIPARILVVEEEAITAEDLQMRLLALGYAIAGCGVTGEESIDLARRENPDLVLIDIRLKDGMTGIEAARAIRTELGIPVIFLTASSNDQVIAEAAASEPFGYLLQPFEERYWKANIEMALYKGRAEREREQLIAELHAALAQVETLSGLLPICAWCKDVQDDDGDWANVEYYVEKHSHAKFSHGICPACEKAHFNQDDPPEKTGPFLK